MLENLGLKENCDYDNGSGRVEIFHEPSREWFPLLETRNKTVIYEDSNENRRTAKAEKVSELNFSDGEVEPIPLVKEKPEPEKVDLFGGILSNTNYQGQNIHVQHENKGFLRLVRTSNKVLFVKEDGKVKRMTLFKLVGVSGIENEKDNMEDVGSSEEVSEEVQTNEEEIAV